MAKAKKPKRELEQMVDGTWRRVPPRFNRRKDYGPDYGAVRRRLDLIAEVFNIPDAEIKKAMNRRTSMPMADFCRKYSQSLDFVLSGDIRGMIGLRGFPHAQE